MLWGEAVHHAVWLKNQTPMKALKHDKTPYKAAHGKKPDLQGLRELAIAGYETNYWLSWVEELMKVSG